MQYEVRWKRLLHVGGTKEYRVFWFKMPGGPAHTVKMWGKVGRLNGHTVERDDHQSVFDKIVREKEAKGYELDGASTQDRVTRLEDHWIENDRGEAGRFGLPAAYRRYLEMKARSATPSVTLEHSDGSSEIVTLDHDPMPTPPRRKPAAPTPPDYSLNPNFGIF